MKLSMQQRIVMNLAAPGMDRYSLDGAGLRTLRSLLKRGLIERDGPYFFLSEEGKKIRESWTG